MPPNSEDPPSNFIEKFDLRSPLVVVPVLVAPDPPPVVEKSSNRQSRQALISGECLSKKDRISDYFGAGRFSGCDAA